MYFIGIMIGAYIIVRMMAIVLMEPPAGTAHSNLVLLRILAWITIFVVIGCLVLPFVIAGTSLALSPFLKLS
jgi:hypothetical protein